MYVRGCVRCTGKKYVVYKDGVYNSRKVGTRGE